MSIKEASVDGNIAVHDDVYTVQLDMDPENLNTKAILCINESID